MAGISNPKVFVLDAFETRSGDWTFADFERALKAAMGKRYSNYQTAKMTILSAANDGRWPKAVERFVRTNHSAFGSVPAEFILIARQLGLGAGTKDGT